LGSALNVIGSVSQFTLVYLFPDGRFAPRWFRWPWLIGASVNTVVTFARGPQLDAFLAGWWPGQILVWGFIVVQLAALIASPVYRYRWASGPVQRQQLKWVLLALVAQPILWPIGAFGIPALFPGVRHTLAGALAYNLWRLALQNLAFFLVPITIGLAILRYRLWDIDVIVRRTLIYSVLTAVLGLAYAGSVLVLESVFRALTGQGQNSLVVVLSTLGIAALFGPVRGRVQAAIDRRFFRRKYDAARILAAFAAQARDVVELEQLTGQLVRAVDETMQPASVSLWVRKGQER
jgi:hypothetical protein